MSPTDRKRVQFRAPEKLIDRADVLASVLGEDRTDILVDALRDYLSSAAHDDQLNQELAGAYYDDEITFDELASLVGRSDAESFRVLEQQLDDDYVDELANR